MSAYYNEWDPHAAQWLRNLINAGHIAPGDIDERSITEVSPDDIKGYKQHHFFAGIGGWSLALRMAGWPDDRPVLTGSPPCQPFSNAGKRKGINDDRHLAPAFLSMVAAIRTPVVFGEQVAAAANKDNWLDDLLDALEAQGYATGAAILPACGVGAPHIRQRLWIAARLADSVCSGQQGSWKMGRSSYTETDEDREEHRAFDDSRRNRVADSRCAQRETTRISSGVQSSNDTAWRPGARDRLDRCEQSQGDSCGQEQCRAGALHASWENADWLFCRDGKWRPVESGTSPLAHGISVRVGRLRAYGNAIVPQVAAEIIKTVMEQDQ